MQYIMHMMEELYAFSNCLVKDFFITEMNNLIRFYMWKTQIISPTKICFSWQNVVPSIVVSSWVKVENFGRDNGKLSVDGDEAGKSTRRQSRRRNEMVTTPVAWQCSHEEINSKIYVCSRGMWRISDVSVAEREI